MFLKRKKIKIIKGIIKNNIRRIQEKKNVL